MDCLGCGGSRHGRNQGHLAIRPMQQMSIATRDPSTHTDTGPKFMRAAAIGSETKESSINRYIHRTENVSVESKLSYGQIHQ